MPTVDATIKGGGASTTSTKPTYRGARPKDHDRYLAMLRIVGMRVCVLLLV